MQVIISHLRDIGSFSCYFLVASKCNCAGQKIYTGLKISRTLVHRSKKSDAESLDLPSDGKLRLKPYMENKDHHFENVIFKTKEIKTVPICLNNSYHQPLKCQPLKCQPLKCQPLKCQPLKCQPLKCQPLKCRKLFFRTL